jgi:hypothetical protein
MSRQIHRYVYSMKIKGYIDFGLGSHNQMTCIYNRAHLLGNLQGAQCKKKNYRKESTNSRVFAKI